VLCTGDSGVLDAPVEFLEGRPLDPADDSYYGLPGRSTATESLYQPACGPSGADSGAAPTGCR